jgi:UDP-N-acetylmuramyl pentapeptide synthase
MSVLLVARTPEPALAGAISSLTDQDFLIVNADDAAIFPFLAKKNNAAKIITYGFNAKACITASSISENNVQVCIQRGFVGPGGNVCEPQEFSAPIPPGTDAGDVLAASAYAVVANA